MIKKLFTQCNLYFGLFVLYEMHGFLYPKTSMLNKLLAFFIIAIGVVHFFKVLSSRKSERLHPFFKAFNTFAIFLSIYGIFNIITGGATPLVTSEVFLKNILLSFLPLYSFFYFSQKGEINSTWIKYAFLVLCLLAFVQFTQNRIEELAEAAVERVNITNNKGYAFLALMPFLVFWKDRRTIQFVLLLFLTAYILMAMKRGAIVIGAFCSTYFIFQSFKNSSSKERFILFVLVGAFVFLLFDLWGDYMSSNTYFQSRLESTLEGDTNGRNDIYSSLYNHFTLDANLFNYFLGFGPDSTIAYYGHYAHQDWIELLLNCGLIGVFMYGLFYIQSFKTVRLFDNDSARICFMMSLFILFGKSMFSMGYQSIGIYQGLSIGYSLSTLMNYKSQKI